MLLHGEGIVGAALDRGIVGDDQALAPADAPNAGDQTRAGRVVVVHTVRRQGAELQERRAGIEEPVNAVAHEELALVALALLVALPPALPGRGEAGAQVGGEGAVVGGVGLGAFIREVELGLDGLHDDRV